MQAAPRNRDPLYQPTADELEFEHISSPLGRVMGQIEQNMLTHREAQRRRVDAAVTERPPLPAIYAQPVHNGSTCLWLDRNQRRHAITVGRKVIIGEVMELSNRRSYRVEPLVPVEISTSALFDKLCEAVEVCTAVASQACAREHAKDPKNNRAHLFTAEEMFARYIADHVDPQRLAEQAGAAWSLQPARAEMAEV